MNTIPCERDVGHWDRYLALTCNRSCSELVSEAVRHVEGRRRAIDLGAGAMSDSRYLLDVGFATVTAVDASPASIPYAEELRRDHGLRPRFEFKNQRFSEFEFEPESADLVHAHFSLPYHGAVGFAELMDAVTESVRLNGVFSAILFGNDDGWKEKKPDLAFVTRGEIDAMLKDFELILCKEMRVEAHVHGGEDASEAGTLKFWHYFRVIGRRVKPVF